MRRFWRNSVAGVVGCGMMWLVGCAPKGIEGLKTSSYAGGQQQEGKVAYAENPPLGGVYSPLWQRCGAYAAPLYDEYAVHSLERGAVWLAYGPGLPAAEVTKLRALLAGYGSWLLSPRADLPTPVVLSAWNAQLQLPGADDPRLPEFLKRYAGPPGTAQQGGSQQGGGQQGGGQQGSGSPGPGAASTSAASTGAANTAPERALGCASGSTQTQ